jgi:hypothetical protein
MNPEELKSLVFYDPSTGNFYSFGGSGRAPAGQVIGTHREEYVRIKLNGISYRAHRLAWLYMTGRWPKEHIDHINGKKHDNRWRNLRECSRDTNLLLHRKPRKDNKLGILGVQQIKNRFRAMFRRKHLGMFDTPEEASACYQKAKREHHEKPL